MPGYDGRVLHINLFLFTPCNISSTYFGSSIHTLLVLGRTTSARKCDVPVHLFISCLRISVSFESQDKPARTVISCVHYVLCKPWPLELNCFVLRRFRRWHLEDWRCCLQTQKPSESRTCSCQTQYVILSSSCNLQFSNIFFKKREIVAVDLTSSFDIYFLLIWQFQNLSPKQLFNTYAG